MSQGKTANSGKKAGAQKGLANRVPYLSGTSLDQPPRLHIRLEIACKQFVRMQVDTHGNLIIGFKGQAKANMPEGPPQCMEMTIPGNPFLEGARRGANR